MATKKRAKAATQKPAKKGTKTAAKAKQAPAKTAPKAKQAPAKTAAKAKAKPKAKKGSAKLGRSYLAGEVTLDEIRSLTKKFTEAAPLFTDEMMDGSEYDVQVVDGDLHVSGDLNTFAHKLVGLVVCGRLTVDGLYTDTDDPACGVFVLGDMQAARVITTGSLGVAGSLTATEALVGFYNDYGAFVGKDVKTPLFHPENHHFQIGGKLEVEHVVGYGAEYRVPKQLTKQVLAAIPKNLRAVLVDALVQGDDDNQELDSEALRRRVREGKPVLRLK